MTDFRSCHFPRSDPFREKKERQRNLFQVWEISPHSSSKWQ